MTSRALTNSLQAIQTSLSSHIKVFEECTKQCRKSKQPCFPEDGVLFENLIKTMGKLYSTWLALEKEHNELIDNNDDEMMDEQNNQSKSPKLVKEVICVEEDQMEEEEDVSEEEMVVEESKEEVKQEPKQKTKVIQQHQQIKKAVAEKQKAIQIKQVIQLVADKTQQLQQLPPLVSIAKLIKNVSRGVRFHASGMPKELLFLGQGGTGTRAYVGEFVTELSIQRLYDLFKSVALPDPTAEENERKMLAHSNGGRSAGGSSVVSRGSQSSTWFKDAIANAELLYLQEQLQRNPRMFLVLWCLRCFLRNSDNGEWIQNNGVNDSFDRFEVLEDYCVWIDCRYQRTPAKELQMQMTILAYTLNWYAEFWPLFNQNPTGRSSLFRELGQMPFDPTKLSQELVMNVFRFDLPQYLASNPLEVVNGQTITRLIRDRLASA